MLLDRLFTDPFRRCWLFLYARCMPKRFERLGRTLAPPSPNYVPEGSNVQLQRINLDRLLTSLRKLLRRFFSRLTLQEPTFEEVVVLYSEYSDEEGGLSLLKLKSFRDIPMADVEVVFPGLRVDRIKSADAVKLVMILLAGVATALYGFFFATDNSVKVRATLIGLLLLRGFQTWRSVVNNKATMDDFVKTTLYHSSQDSQKGVLLYTINSIEQHEHRECAAPQPPSPLRHRRRPRWATPTPSPTLPGVCCCCSCCCCTSTAKRAAAPTPSRTLARPPRRRHRPPA
jgi:hypothetical protein